MNNLSIMLNVGLDKTVRPIKLLFQRNTKIMCCETKNFITYGLKYWIMILKYVF